MNKQEDPDPNPTQDDQETIAPTPSPTWEETPTVAPNLSSCENSFGSTNFIGEYELMEEIARGGMGVVFKARHRNLNRIAAVKMILGGRFSSAEEVQRFRIEAESAAKLDHPAIVPIYEIGEHEGQAFFAMKYIDGGSLAEKVTQFSDRPRDAAALIAKVAEGVNHAHQRAVLHRDLKPANILLDRQGQPWVADLGLAKSTSGETDITRTGAVLGTPTYMPPEQAAGKSVTTAADIYSLGAILYQLLSGRPPYQGDTSVSIVMQVIEGPPPSLRSLNRDLDRDLELIVQKCLERNPDDRYTSAQDLANDLQKWLDGEPISIKPPSIGALVNTWFRRNEKLVYAIFAVFVGILLCAPAVLTFTNGEQNDVYQKFSVTEKPFLYKIEAPEWLVAASVIFLILVLIPSIGFLNAAISRPKTFLDALWAGVSTSVVLSVIFYFLLGWMIFLNGANNYINQDIAKLTAYIWPPEKQGSNQIQLKDIYSGLDSIPENERAVAVAERISADIYASAPRSILAGLGISFGFAILIVIGTLVGYVLLYRSIPVWLKMIRYLIAFVTTCMLMIGLVGLILSMFSSDVKFSRDDDSLPIFVTLPICLIIAWLSLRKWRRKTVSIQSARSST